MIPMPREAELTERQLSILRKLFKEGKVMRVRRVKKTQTALAEELGITRQALSSHLRELRELELLKAGRGFIDLSEKARRILGEGPTQAFVFAKIEPKKRRNVYKEIMSLDVLQAFRVTGDVDLIVVVDRQKLDKVLKVLSGIDGVKGTSAHLVLSPLVEGKF
jgi:DNA-binding Lrp family transcriptional regulator